ncbi:MAG: hypothetical protein MUC84_02310 [Solirubrobacteraceae bacterium]|jgi:hypothetical protein|nr:hypothetical protein [Solirubrobacteraceae bacterium]MCU0312880.1 hypothetical protein [Solirubrobacteraceae bacterium]
MAPSLVRPEFGPTLPELAGPRWRALSRGGRIAVAVLAAIVAVVLLLRLLAGDDRTTVVVSAPVAFNLVYDDAKLDRVAAPPGTSLRLVTPASDPDPESVTVAPLRLPAYRGDINGVLPVYAATVIRDMRRADPDFVLRSEGRTRINRQPGYQIQFQTERAGRTTYGRRTFLFQDEPAQREGADILLLAARSPSMPNVDAVGSNGPTKLPYRSFRLGTERP